MRSKLLIAFFIAWQKVVAVLNSITSSIQFKQGDPFRFIVEIPILLLRERLVFDEETVIFGYGIQH